MNNIENNNNILIKPIIIWIILTIIVIIWVILLMIEIKNK